MQPYRSTSLYQYPYQDISETMTAPNKNVVFDVVGTLVSYEHLYEAIKERLGDKLIPRGIRPTLLGIWWLEMAERGYAYLSLHGPLCIVPRAF